MLNNKSYVQIVYHFCTFGYKTIQSVFSAQVKSFTDTQLSNILGDNKNGQQFYTSYEKEDVNQRCNSPAGTMDQSDTSNGN